MSIRFTASRLRVTLSQDGRAFEMIADGFDVGSGEVVAVTGKSGSGKTLLLEVLGLLRRADPGSSYEIEGMAEPLSLHAAWDARDGQADLARLRRELFGFVPQSGGLLNFVDVERNIALAQKLCGRIDHAYVSHLLERLGLQKQRTQRPDSLSIGERQRVAIARALVHRPLIVIADEPTSSLDPYLSQEVMSLFLDLAADQRTAVVVSTHDTSLVAALGLRRLVMVADVLPADRRSENEANAPSDHARSPVAVVSRLADNEAGPEGRAA